jgi:hypothetical protein
MRKLKYTLERSGGSFIAVKPHCISQCCSNCKHIAKDGHKTPVEFCCIQCWHTQHAHLNAAITVLAAQYAVKAYAAREKSIFPFGAMNSAAINRNPLRALLAGIPPINGWVNVKMLASFLH